MLKSGQLFEATLHESLMYAKKTLAVNLYSEIALRMTTPGCLPAWLFYDVPLAFAGSCEEIDGTLKVTNLVGTIVLKPIARFRPPQNKM